eukprot:3892506-Pyramimonas_sp.AAC.1
MDAAQHRCPLFSPSLGTTPTQTLAVDSMHSLYLGVIQRMVSACLWRIMLHNSWQFQGTQAGKIEMACRQIQTDLLQWQRDPGNNIAHNLRLRNLTLKMLGKQRGFSHQDLRD